MIKPAFRNLTILFFCSFVLFLNPKEVFAGNTCAYISLNKYLCGAWDVCGTGASCGTTCKTGTPGIVNCGGPNGCDYICDGAANNCLSERRYIDFVAPEETKSWESWNGDIVDPYGARTNVDSTNKIPISYTSPVGKLTFIASASRSVGVSGIGLTGIQVKNVTTNQTYKDVANVKRLPCSSIFNASNRYALGNLDGTNSACRRYEGWVGCYYGMENDYIGYSDVERESACGWLASSGPPWLDEINFQIDESDLAVGNNEFEVSILGEDGSGACETKIFNYIYNPDNNPPTNPGDPTVLACLPISGGDLPITFTASTDSDSGLSHYVVNVDEANNNSGNFSSICSDTNNFGDICVSTTFTSFSYNFNDSKTYRMWIDAYDNAGNKSSSNVVTYFPKTLPPAPSSITATDGLISKVNISWVDNSNQTYNSERGFNILKNGNIIGSVLPNITSYTDSNNSCDGSGSLYNVSAFNSCGNSVGAVPNSGSCITLNNNKWWQVFNGGVHSNGGIVLSNLPFDDFLVGDALSVDHPIFFGESIANYNSYGLVSSFNNLVDISNGEAGISGHNYFTDQLSTDMENIATPEFFDKIRAVGSAFHAEPTASLSSIGASKSPSYFERSASDTINSVISYDKNKIVAIIFAPSTGTLTIRKNILDTSLNHDKFFMIFVDGNVLIDSSVTTLDALIYASGKITVESKGPNLDSPLFVYGGLHGNELLLQRDLKDIHAYANKPAEIISYNHYLMINQNDVPFEIKKALVKWIIND